MSGPWKLLFLICAHSGYYTVFQSSIWTQALFVPKQLARQLYPGNISHADQVNTGVMNMCIAPLGFSMEWSPLASPLHPGSEKGTVNVFLRS